MNEVCGAVTLDPGFRRDDKWGRRDDGGAPYSRQIENAL